MHKAGRRLPSRQPSRGGGALSARAVIAAAAGLANANLVVASALVGAAVGAVARLVARRPAREAARKVQLEMGRLCVEGRLCGEGM